jgi:hypothetical protein
MQKLKISTPILEKHNVVAISEGIITSAKAHVKIKVSTDKIINTVNAVVAMFLIFELFILFVF